jgi:hypothetical protein
MIRTKEFEKWTPQAAATLVAIPEVAIQEVATRVEGILGVAAIRGEDIPGAGGIRAVGIPGVATQVEGILEGAVAEVILGAEAEDPTGDEELQRKALKTTRKCSR